MAQIEQRGRYEVSALKRGLLILDCFTASPDRVMTASEVARAVGIHRATVLRFLHTLEDSGYLEPGGRQGLYRLGPKGRPRGQVGPWLAAMHLSSVPILKSLAEESGETADVGILYEGAVVLVQVAEGPQSVRARQRVGDRRPANVTSVGKVLLAGLSEPEFDAWLDGRTLEVQTPNSIASPQRLRAELAQIRQIGYAVDEQEYELGLACIAAPVRDSSGATVAAVAISGPSSRVTYHRMPKLVAMVQRAADRLAAALTEPLSSLRVADGTVREGEVETGSISRM